MIGHDATLKSGVTPEVPCVRRPGGEVDIINQRLRWPVVIG